MEDVFIGKVVTVEDEVGQKYTGKLKVRDKHDEEDVLYRAQCDSEESGTVWVLIKK